MARASYWGNTHYTLSAVSIRQISKLNFLLGFLLDWIPVPGPHTTSKHQTCLCLFRNSTGSLNEEFLSKIFSSPCKQPSYFNIEFQHLGKKRSINNDVKTTQLKCSTPLFYSSKPVETLGLGSSEYCSILTLPFPTALASHISLHFTLDN